MEIEFVISSNSLLTLFCAGVSDSLVVGLIAVITVSNAPEVEEVAEEEGATEVEEVA